MAEENQGESTDDVGSPAQAEKSDVQWDSLSNESDRGTGDDRLEEDPDESVAVEEGEESLEAEVLTTEEEPETPAPESDAEEPATEPEVVAPVQLTPEQQAEQIRQYQQAQANRHAQLEDYYKIDEDDALMLATEPEKILPKLAATLHMEVLANARAELQQLLPQMLKNVQTTDSRETKAQTDFYGAWPELKGRDNEVLQMGVMFRQLNPKATAQEAIQRIGQMTMDALGIERKAGGTKNPAPPPAKRQSAPAPFKPASGTGAAPQRSAKGSSPWDALLDDE